MPKSLLQLLKIKDSKHFFYRGLLNGILSREGSDYPID